MNTSDELAEIQRLWKETGLSAYDIAKNTNLSEAGIGKILNGKVKRPHKSSVESILNYLRKSAGMTQTSLKEPDAHWVNYNKPMMVPMVHIRAQAGFLSAWGDSEYVDELPKIPWEADHEGKGNYMCFEVTGDSMWNENSADSLFERDVLLCREIQRHHWRNKLHINTWKYFVIVHKEQGILVKQITEHDTERGTITLHSLNPYFEDQVVHLDDLLALYNVVDFKRSARR